MDESNNGRPGSAGEKSDADDKTGKEKNEFFTRDSLVEITTPIRVFTTRLRLGRSTWHPMMLGCSPGTNRTKYKQNHPMNSFYNPKMDDES